MRVTATESHIVRAIRERLAREPGVKVIKIRGGLGQEAGTPDILGCALRPGMTHGVMLALEVKRPGQKPTALQKKRLAEWQAAGAIAAVVTSVDEALGLITEGKAL